MHIEDHPILGKDKRTTIQFYFNDEILKAKFGQTIAAALMMNNKKKLGVSRKLQQSRGVFCANARCYSCFVTVENTENVLSCSTLVKEGMKVYSSLTDPDIRRINDGY